MKHIKYYEDDSFSFLYTEEPEALFLHCYVYEWKLSVLKKMIKVFGEFLNEFSGKLIMSITPNPKYCEMLGGKVIEELDGNLKVVIWEQKL